DKHRLPRPTSVWKLAVILRPTTRWLSGVEAIVERSISPPSAPLRGRVGMSRSAAAKPPLPDPTPNLRMKLGTKKNALTNQGVFARRPARMQQLLTRPLHQRR